MKTHHKSCLKQLLVLAAVVHSISVIQAVPLASKKSTAIAVADNKSSAANRLVIPITTDIGDSNADNWDDDDEQLDSVEEESPMIIVGNRTDSDLDDLSRLDVDSFVVRLARALQQMHFVNVPKTVVLNKPECIEHTHTHQEPTLLGPRIGQFADEDNTIVNNEQPSSGASHVGSSPTEGDVATHVSTNKRPITHSKSHNVWRSKHSYGNGGPALAGPSGCCGKNVYNGPVILISNVRDLKLVNPQPGSDFGESINGGEVADEDDSSDESSAEAANAGNTNDIDSRIDLGDII